MEKGKILRDFARVSFIGVVYRKEKEGGGVRSAKSRKEKQRQESLLSLMAGATCESRLSSRL